MKKPKLNKKEKEELLKNLVIQLVDNFDGSDIFNEIERQADKAQIEDLTKEFVKNKLLVDGDVLVTDLNLVSTNELKTFCKQNDLKALSYWDY